MRSAVGDDARVAAQAFVVERGERIGDDIDAGAYGAALQEGSEVGGNVWLAAGPVKLARQIAGDLAGGVQNVHIVESIGGDVEPSVADSEAEPAQLLLGTLPTGLRCTDWLLVPSHSLIRAQFFNCSVFDAYLRRCYDIWY